MGLEKVWISIDMHGLVVSPEILSKIADNVNFLGKLPALYVDNRFRGKETKYDRRMISISVENDGIAEGHISSLEAIKYTVFDRGDVEGYKNTRANTAIGYKTFREEDIRALKRSKS